MANKDVSQKTILKYDNDGAFIPTKILYIAIIATLTRILIANDELIISEK